MIRNSIFVVLGLAYTGCMSGGGGLDELEDPEVETVEQEEALGPPYSATGTNNATVSAATAKFPLTFAAGETVMIGTQDLAGASFSGDTVLRLRNAANADLVVNDDACGPIRGSRMTFTSPVAATHTVWAGCFQNSSCGPSVVAISRRHTTYGYSATNTNNATANTFDRQFTFNGGEVVRVSTCAFEATGASASGDTLLRLFRQLPGGSFVQVAANDNGVATCNACGSASLILFTIPAAGVYEVRAGCALNGSCSGTVAVYRE